MTCDYTMIWNHSVSGKRSEGPRRRWRARADLNCRPFAPQANALSGLSYGREVTVWENRVNSITTSMEGQAARPAEIDRYFLPSQPLYRKSKTQDRPRL